MIARTLDVICFCYLVSNFGLDILEKKCYNKLRDLKLGFGVETRNETRSWKLETGKRHNEHQASKHRASIRASITKNEEFKGLRIF